MSRRNRGGAGTTYVNNVRGPTSALTSFLNERGIRRANPAPAPEQNPIQDPEQDEDAEEDDDEEDEEGEEEEASVTVATSRTTRTARLTRSRVQVATAASTSSSSSRSKSKKVAAKEDAQGNDSDDDDSDNDDDDDDDYTSTSVSVKVSTRSTRTRPGSTSAASKAPPSKKRPRKKGDSDDSDNPNEKEFQDITGFVSRSKFSHKGRMPHGTNKIEFCSRCRARFTVKAGTTAATDEDTGGLLCPSCSGESPSTPISASKSRPVKRLRRKIQKAEIESQIPSLQDLCIKKIASCIDDVEALGDISDINLDKICKILCRNRFLTDNTVHIFFDSRHNDMTLYDCTEITPSGLINLAQFCPNLRSLQLKFCGRIDDSVIEYYTQHLSRLTALYLIGPILITEGAYIRFFEAMGEKFERFELKHSARFSLNALQALCKNCPNLTHLRLGDCGMMDNDWIDTIANLSKLRSLRIRNPEKDRLDTDTIVKLIQAVGSGLEELEIKGCTSLEDAVLTDAILPCCPRLDRLNVAGCEGFTAGAVEKLFRDWTINRGLNYLNLENCIDVNDDALKAITSHSGETLETLNIKGLEELTKESLVTISKCENLFTLDVSWCRAMDDDVMKLLVDNAPRLSKVFVWGDHRLTECCPSRPGLKIIGREGDYLDMRFI